MFPSYDPTQMETQLKTQENVQSELSTNYLLSWIGEYHFSEFEEAQIGSNLTMTYSITVYEEQGMYYANVVIDGNHTMLRVRALLQGDSESIDLIFYSYLPGNLHERFDGGDILLTFTKEGDDIITTWGCIQPALAANEKPYIHFQLRA